MQERLLRREGVRPRGAAHRRGASNRHLKRRVRASNRHLKRLVRCVLLLCTAFARCPKPWPESQGGGGRRLLAMTSNFPTRGAQASPRDNRGRNVSIEIPLWIPDNRLLAGFPARRPVPQHVDGRCGHEEHVKAVGPSPTPQHEGGKADKQGDGVGNDGCLASEGRQAQERPVDSAQTGREVVLIPEGGRSDQVRHVRAPRGCF